MPNRGLDYAAAPAAAAAEQINLAPPAASPEKEEKEEAPLAAAGASEQGAGLVMGLGDLAGGRVGAKKKRKKKKKAKGHKGWSSDSDDDKPLAAMGGGLSKVRGMLPVPPREPRQCRGHPLGRTCPSRRPRLAGHARDPARRAQHLVTAAIAAAAWQLLVLSPRG